MLEQIVKDIAGKFGMGDKSDQLVALLTKQIDMKGGLPGLLQGFQAQGLGEQADSWVSTGENKPVTADQAKAVLGDDFVSEAAGKLGVEPHKVSEAASEMIPDMVDKLTPEGKVPEGGDLMGQLQGMLGGMDLSKVGGMLGGLMGGDKPGQ